MVELEVLEVMAMEGEVLLAIIVMEEEEEEAVLKVIAVE